MCAKGGGNGPKDEGKISATPALGRRNEPRRGNARPKKPPMNRRSGTLRKAAADGWKKGS